MTAGYRFVKIDGGGGGGGGVITGIGFGKRACLSGYWLMVRQDGLSGYWLMVRQDGLFLSGYWLMVRQDELFKWLLAYGSTR